MKNKIYLDFENGLDAKYKRWTEEAIHDFISLFPEYEDQFEVGKGNLTLHNYNTLVTVARQNKDNNPNFDLASFAKQFEQRSDGSYQVSVNKQAALATSNGVLDIEKWSQLQREASGGKYAPAGPTFVAVLKAPAAGNIRGISSGSSIGISAGTCAALGLQGAELKNYFKDIIMHELGHRFNATHEGRKNVVENLGTHCTDADCLMYEYAYMLNNSTRRRGKNNPFCSECMASMREYMQNVMKFERSNEQSSVNHLQAVDIRSLPLFKDISEGELIALDNYMRILEENNIQRSPQEQLLDMISIFASARGGHNLSSDKEDNVIGEDKFLLATAKTDWNDAAQLSILQGKIYSFKRYVAYKPPFKIEDMESPTPAVEAVEKAQLNQGNLARVSDEGYWIRKYGQGYFDNIKANPQKELHRFILNVNPSEDLFQKLDDFAFKFGCQYKFPHLLSWNGRIDPVVIYTSDDRIAEQQKELVKIAAPYVRRERMTNGLDGTRIADGIFMAKERDKSDILALAQKAEPRLPKLAAKLRQEAQDSRNHPLSLGEFLAYEAIVANINSVPSQNHIVSLPEFNFENPGRREIFHIYNRLKKQNALMAQKLDKLCDKHNSDWPQIAADPQFKQIKAEFEKTQLQKKTPENVHISNEPLSETAQDKSFKKALREVFQPAAQKEGSTYVEDIKAQNYQARIEHADGSVDHIEASSAVNISLTSADKDGNPQVPGMERFRNIVEYAQKQNRAITFGDIRSPEFKARLMIACLEANPPVKMKGAPATDKTFVDSLSDDLKKQLHRAMLAAKRRQQPQQPKTEEETTAAPQNDYEKSRETRKNILENKEKLGKISKIEKAELEDIRAIILNRIEFNKAAKKYGDENDPRFAEHKQKSGFGIENYYYSSKAKRVCADWKLHLDVVPNRGHPTTKAVSEFLEKLDIEHKIAHGGENGKGMTIYVGSYNDTLRLAKEINARFGKEIEPSPRYVDQALSEHYFNPKVCGRFYMQNIFDTQYPRSFVAGICPAAGTRNSELERESGQYRIFDLGQKNGIIPAEDQFSDNSYQRLYFRCGDYHKSYVFQNLEAYCSHKLYEKELGEFYCGKNSEKFERDFFGDRLPEKGSPERAQWDMTAQQYVSFIEKEHPNIIGRMQQEKQKYIPLDFSKLPPAPIKPQTKQSGR